MKFNNANDETVTTLTGQDEGDESKKTVAAPKDEARKDDVSDIRRDMLYNNRLLPSSTDHNHLLLLLLLRW